MNKKESADTLFKALFHLLFWGFLLIFPLVLRNQRPPDFPRPAISVVGITGFNLLLLPVFFLNSNWLIPHVLHKKGVFKYVLSLFGLVVGSFFGLQFLRILLATPSENMPKAIVILPLMMVTAISTGYGLLVYLNDQEKLKQAQESERLQSELSFLRSQVSPHFMFNILNGLVYLIHKNSPEAKNVVIKLADLMRYMLYESDVTMVTLAKEMDYLQNYIDLQKLRFGSDITIIFNKNIGIEHYFIEPMLLIPFVENAFKHGIFMIEKPSILINVEQKEDSFLLFVENKVNDDFSKKKDKSSGIGLKNVQRRLELLYPKNHELIISQSPEFYQITLRIQLKTRK